VNFTSSNPVDLHLEKPYPTGMIRFSLSSIPYPSHLLFTLNGLPLNLSTAFAPGSQGSLDRRWLEVQLPKGLPPGSNTITVELTPQGKDAEEGQGGKMLTSLEVIEYGGEGRFNFTEGNIGAYPTFSIHGRMTLRPVSRVASREMTADVCRLTRSA
jgi:hypothetical protein